MFALAPDESGPPLVSRCISHRKGDSRKRLPPPVAFEILPVDVRVVRESDGIQPEHLKDVKRGQVQMFSPASASRLTRTARNAMPALVSQFCLTYHQSNPDGQATKKHLDAWLKVLRRAAPGVGYLWILEFQSRGVPHFHVWLTEPFSESLWKRLGAAWNRIVEPESLHHLWWHTQERPGPDGKPQRSFINWDMKGAGYLRKYMSKAAQKCVPESFGWVGRFWGCTRGLVPDADFILAEDVPNVADLTRQVSKYVEARRRRGARVARKIAQDKGRTYQKVNLRPTARAQPRSGWLNNATPAFFKLLRYADVQDLKRLQDEENEARSRHAARSPVN